MAEIVVQIERDTDTGKVLVGLVPQGGETLPEGSEGEEQAEGSYLKPVKDVAAALQVAGDLLQGQTGEQAQAAEAESDFQKGFGKNQPAGPVPPGA